jgi:hypothetical protein
LPDCGILPVKEAEVMRSPTTREWIIGATAVSLGMLVAIGVLTPPGDRVALALRATARWSFLWFWLASTGAALVTLFGPRFQPQAQRARDFGLAFASAHLVHIGLAVFLLYVLAVPFPLPKLIFFAVGAFWVYLLALLSIRRAAVMLPPRAGRILRSIGVEYITLVFLDDFYRKPFEGSIANLVIYLPFLVMAVAGPVLRIAAAIKRRAREQAELGLERRIL